jgi:hypothetical protein
VAFCDVVSAIAGVVVGASAGVRWVAAVIMFTSSQLFVYTSIQLRRWLTG